MQSHTVSCGIALCLAACNPGQRDSKGPENSYEGALRNAALARCIARVYASTSTAVSEDAYEVGSVFVQEGPFSEVEPFYQIDELSAQFAGREFVEYEGKRYLLMKCIHLLQSQELDSLVKEILRKHGDPY